jgi:hypothetical protein
MYLVSQIVPTLQILQLIFGVLFSDVMHATFPAHFGLLVVIAIIHFVNFFKREAISAYALLCTVDVACNFPSYCYLSCLPLTPLLYL